MATHTQDKSKLNLYNVSSYKKYLNTSEDPECGICYKHISNKVLVCSKPCKKTFHRDCIQKMIEGIEDNITDKTPKPDYRCCYCRRKFDIHAYDFTLFLQDLKHVENHGYCIDDAIIEAMFETRFVSIQTKGEYGIFDQIHTNYSVYLPMDISHIKTPKFAKHAEFKKKNKRLHKLIHMYKGRR